MSDIKASFDISLHNDHQFTLQALTTVSPQEYTLLSNISIDNHAYRVNCPEASLFNILNTIEIQESNQDIPCHNQSLISHIINALESNDFLIFFNTGNDEYPDLEDSHRSQTFILRPDYYIKRRDPESPNYILVSDPTPFLEFLNKKPSSICGLLSVPKPFIFQDLVFREEGDRKEHILTENIDKNGKFISLKSKHGHEYKFITQESFKIEECIKEHSGDSVTCNCPVILHTKYHVQISKLNNYSGPLVDVGNLENILNTKQDEYSEFTTYTFHDIEETYPTIWNVSEDHIFVMNAGMIIERHATNVVKSSGPVDGRKQIINNMKFQTIYAMEFKGKKIYLNMDDYFKVSGGLDFVLVRKYDVGYGDKSKLDKISEIDGNSEKDSKCEVYMIENRGRVKILSRKKVEGILNSEMLKKFKKEIVKLEGERRFELNLELGLKDLDEYRRDYENHIKDLKMLRDAYEWEMKRREDEEKEGKEGIQKMGKNDLENGSVVEVEVA